MEHFKVTITPKPNKTSIGKACDAKITIVIKAVSETHAKIVARMFLEHADSYEFKVYKVV